MESHWTWRVWKGTVQACEAWELHRDQIQRQRRVESVGQVQENAEELG